MTTKTNTHHKSKNFLHKLTQNTNYGSLQRKNGTIYHDTNLHIITLSNVFPKKNIPIKKPVKVKHKNSAYTLNSLGKDAG